MVTIKAFVTLGFDGFICVNYFSAPRAKFSKLELVTVGLVKRIIFLILLVVEELCIRVSQKFMH